MIGASKKLLQATAGNAGGAGLDVDEVFSTYLYTGDGSSTARAFENGIDLAGEGGLVWTKGRSNADQNALVDTERMNGGRMSKVLNSDSTSNAVDYYNYGIEVMTPSSTGYDLKNSELLFNGSSRTYASWTFRKAPKFFDVVVMNTNSGSHGTTTHSHSLGVKPAMIIVKRTEGGSWYVFHKDATNNSDSSFRTFLSLNGTGAEAVAGSTIITATSTEFTYNSTMTEHSSEHIVYLFAHNDGDGEFGPDGDQDIIKCGSFTFPSSGDVEIDLGFEPQWVITKRIDGASPWWIADTMRGWAAQETGSTLSSQTGGNLQALFADSTNAEVEYDYGGLTSTGFKWASNFNAGTGNTKYIYIAIRRGPLAPPESATEVFAIDTRRGTNPKYESTFPVDFALSKTTGTGDFRAASRITQKTNLKTNTNEAESASSFYTFEFNNGWGKSTASADSTYYSWMWKRAPNYFDVVTYTGTGGYKKVYHNLATKAEMIWIKRRDSSGDWGVYFRDASVEAALLLNNVNAAQTSGIAFTSAASSFNVFNSSFPMSNSVSGADYIAYLFASLPGISKVGSYTGNGTSQTIDCGFTSGARFVLSKCVSHTGAWYVFDTERGIVSGNDRVLELDSSNPEVSYPGIDPQSSGFIVNNNITNESGRTFIFYAIA